MVQLSESKFQALSEEHQHRICCKLLRRVFEEEDKSALQTYLNVCDWLRLEPLNKESRERVADRFHWHLRQSGRGLSEANLLQSAQQKDRTQPVSDPLSVHVYLDRLRSAHNVGSILRTMDAFRLGTVFFSSGMCSAAHPQVQQTSMGTYEWVPSVTLDASSELPEPLVALETDHHRGISLYDFVFPQQCTIVLGNEETGCSRNILQHAVSTIYIPMHGRKNSLNVANAFAVVASEVRRQYDFKQQRNLSNG